MFKKIISFLLSIFVSTSVTAGDRILVISDLDDTLKMTGIRDTDMIVNYLKGVKPFTELVAAFNEISQNFNADFVYISNVPKLLKTKKWLKKYGLPDGELYDRSMSQIIHGSGIAHKSMMINQIFDERLDQYDRVFMFGDNGEYDPSVYIQAVDNFNAEKKVKIFIRDVMIEATRFSEDQTLVVLDGINYFLDEYELFKYPEFDFISDELREIARQKDADMDLPPFMLERIEELR